MAIAAESEGQVVELVGEQGKQETPAQAEDTSSAGQSEPIRFESHGKKEKVTASISLSLANRWPDLVAQLSEEDRITWQRFVEWEQEHPIPKLFQMKEPLLPAQLVKLKHKHDPQLLADVMLDMQNSATLLKKYDSARGGWIRSRKNRGTVQPRAQIELTPTHEEFYLSMFGMDNSIHEHLEVTRGPQTCKSSVTRFAGSYFAEFLYFDLDRDGDLSGSLASTRDLLRRLYQRFQFSPKQLFLCFSGSKGFHVGLHQSLFGGFTPSPELPKQLNDLAARLLAECHELTLAELQTKVVEAKKAGQNFADVDLRIYNANRIFRVINSRNAKSGRYKVGLTSTELLHLPLDELLDLAPRPDYKPEVHLTAQTPLPGLIALWEYARTFDVAAFTKQAGVKNGTGSIDRDFFLRPTPTR